MMLFFFSKKQNKKKARERSQSEEKSSEGKGVLYSSSVGYGDNERFSATLGKLMDPFPSQEAIHFRSLNPSS